MSYKIHINIYKPPIIEKVLINHAGERLSYFSVFSIEGYFIKSQS